MNKPELINYGQWTNFYKHESYINDGRLSQKALHQNQNPGTEYRSAIYTYQSRPSQLPSNFIGIKSIRPPPIMHRPFVPINANQDLANVHILRTMPVQKMYNVIC